VTKRLRVLVVDDCPDTTRVLALLLKRWGHEVNYAHDGAQALEKTSAATFDVILLDIDLPGMDGFEVAEILRKQPAHDATLLIAATGHVEEEYRVKAAAAGFDTFLTKPILAKQLRELLHFAATAVPG